MEFSITLPQLLVALVIATAVYLLESVFLSRRRSASRLGDEVEAVKAQLAGLSQRLAVLEARLGAESAVETGDEAYDQAVQCARQGMPAADIAARCAISRDEAALIVAMRGKGVRP